MAMKTTKTVKPSSSYQVELPQHVCEQFDGKVQSFWLSGGPLLLQFSSYIRGEGEQVGARDRLKDRIVKHDGQWKIWETKICPDPAVDQATGEFTDNDGVLWVHSYLVWPHLTVYSTISGPRELVADVDNWAIQSLRSIRLITH
jgi:hypothetical protein